MEFNQKLRNLTGTGSYRSGRSYLKIRQWQLAEKIEETTAISNHSEISN